MSDTNADVLTCVQNGINTTKEIADYLDLSRGRVNRVLLELVEQGHVVRESEGQAYVYYPADNPPAGMTDEDTAPVTMAAHLDALAAEAANEEPVNEPGVFKNGQKVDKQFDHEAAIPQPTEYIPTDGEYDEILAEVELREAVGKPFHGRVVGPTGSAKTTLVQALASSFDSDAWGDADGIPMYTIQATYSLNDADIIGYADGVKTSPDDDVPFAYGDAIKALEASAHGPVVLLIDEVNRAPARAKGALFSVLDHRATVDIGFTDEKVVGNPMNLILFSTMNTGLPYQTDKLDLAEVRRLGGEWEIDYLGIGTPSREVALLMSRAPIARDLAEDMVDAANYIREDVDRSDNSPYKVGIPTPNVIDWARSAAMYAARDLDNPVVRAMRTQILPIYTVLGGNAAAEVESYLADRFDGREVHPPQSANVSAEPEPETDDGEDDEEETLGDLFAKGDDEDESDDDAESFGCLSCGHVGSADEFEQAGYACPDCDSDDITPL